MRSRGEASLLTTVARGSRADRVPHLQTSSDGFNSVITGYKKNPNIMPGTLYAHA